MPCLTFALPSPCLALNALPCLQCFALPSLPCFAYNALSCLVLNALPCPSKPCLALPFKALPCVNRELKERKEQKRHPCQHLRWKLTLNKCWGNQIMSVLLRFQPHCWSTAASQKAKPFADSVPCLQITEQSHMPSFSLLDCEHCQILNLQSLWSKAFLFLGNHLMESHLALNLRLLDGVHLHASGLFLILFHYWGTCSLTNARQMMGKNPQELLSITPKLPARWTLLSTFT